MAGGGGFVWLFVCLCGLVARVGLVLNGFRFGFACAAGFGCLGFVIFFGS